MVEHWSEEPGVGGSNPSRGTKLKVIFMDKEELKKSYDFFYDVFYDVLSKSFKRRMFLPTDFREKVDKIEADDLVRVVLLNLYTKNSQNLKEDVKKFQKLWKELKDKEKSKEET